MRDGTLKTVEEALEHGATLPINAVRVTASHPGLSEMKAKEIWTAFEKNGAYQFNKSHSVAYSLISYQSMWLKTHYPAEFFAAALTILGEDKHQGWLKMR